MSILKQAVGLYEEGLSVRQVAAALRISKSEAERLRLRARGAGLVVSIDNTVATEANISNGNKSPKNYLAVKSGNHMKRQRFVIVDRLQNLAVARAMCVVSCGLVLAGSAKAAFNGAFETSSGNIVCDLSNTQVVCVIKSGLEPAPPKKQVCNGGDPVSNRVDLSAIGIAEPVACPAILGRWRTKRVRKFSLKAPQR